VSLGLLPDPHVIYIRDVAPRTPGVCPDCIAAGSRWVHLRMCLTCGKVGCCDASPLRHARAHAASAEHPIIRSVEPGEDWRWCYIDETFV
jgi:hypothetical protein